MKQNEEVEIADGVFVLRPPVGDGVPRLSNAYWLPRLGLLVEPTIHDPHVHGPAWVRWMDEHPVRYAIITHGHTDHVRGVHDLTNPWQLPVYGPPRVLGVTHPLCGGESVLGFDVLHTPGHDPRHLCFFDGETLILGDMLSTDGPALIPEIGGDAGAYEESCRTLAQLHAELGLPGHGDAISHPWGPA